MALPPIVRTDPQSCYYLYYCPLQNGITETYDQKKNLLEISDSILGTNIPILGAWDALGYILTVLLAPKQSAHSTTNSYVELLAIFARWIVVLTPVGVELVSCVAMTFKTPDMAHPLHKAAPNITHRPAREINPSFQASRALAAEKIGRSVIQTTPRGTTSTTIRWGNRDPLTLNPSFAQETQNFKSIPTARLKFHRGNNNPMNSPSRTCSTKGTTLVATNLKHPAALNGQILRKNQTPKGSTSSPLQEIPSTDKRSAEIYFLMSQVDLSTRSRPRLQTKPTGIILQRKGRIC
jgi:hypothetical protein